MYTQKESFQELRNELPEGCNAVVVKYKTDQGKDVSLFDIALAGYEFACKESKHEDFVLVIGFKGFKKLTMTWNIQNPVLEPVTAIESAIEIAKEMTIHLRKYYDRAQLVRDYKDDINSILDNIERATIEVCQKNLDKVKSDENAVPMNVDETDKFIVFAKEEKL